MIKRYYTTLDEIIFRFDEIALKFDAFLVTFDETCANMSKYLKGGNDVLSSTSCFQNSENQLNILWTFNKNFGFLMNIFFLYGFQKIWK